jgi:hypothetical protein
MSSSPGDTKEETRRIGESGIQGAGIRDSAIVVDRPRDLVVMGQAVCSLLQPLFERTFVSFETTNSVAGR